MAELKEVFDMATKQTEPDVGSWRDQERRQRRAARHRRLGAIALVAAMVVVTLVFAFSAAGPDRTKSPAQTPSVGPTQQVPPLGLQVMGLDGSVISEIDGLPDDAEGVQVSPDGSRLAFISEDRVATLSLTGGSVQYLTDRLDNAGGDAQNGVSWSPDGSQIVYAAHDDIYVMHDDGSRVRRLTSDPLGDYHPAWSSQDVIAYWRGKTTGEDGGPENAEIYTVPAAGGTPTRLTHHDGPAIEPTWSPDGSQIAFFSTRDGSIRVMDADGTNDRLLYRSGENDGWAPSWSPDGTRIAFLHCCSPGLTRPLLDVRVLTIASGEVVSLSADVVTDNNGPDWYSNGSVLVNRFD
jgi:Tol biopolymer transport system component